MPPATSITLIEKRETFGLGRAYGTSHPNHLLNVRAANMSAFADDPGHFQRWLAENADLADAIAPGAMLFAPRRTYGRYIQSLIDSYDVDQARIRRVKAEVCAIRKTSDGVIVTTRSGERIIGDYAVLATGFSEPDLHDPWVRDPWERSENAQISSKDPVLILGTGLTMVDLVISLRSNSHSGPIYAISRRGLLPQTHQPSLPLPLSAVDVPFGRSTVELWRWLRELCLKDETAAGDWRAAVDAIRPYTAEIWQRLPIKSKRRFLRHARAWWDVHRHRMAPSIAAEISAARASDQLEIIAGKVGSITTGPKGAHVVYHPRGTNKARAIDVACVFNCMGVTTNPRTSGNAAIQSLLKQNLARADELGLGLDIADNNALKSADGIASDRLFAVGPITRGAYWEMVAVPDIRQQCAKVSAELIARSRAPTKGFLLTHHSQP